MPNKATDQQQPRESLTTEQAADLLGLSTATLPTWRCLGKGPPFVKLERTVRYRRADLLALTALALMNPPLGRAVAPEFSVSLKLLLLLGLLAHAKLRKRPRRPYAIGLLVYLCVTGVVVFVSLIQPEILDWVWQSLWG